MDEEETFPIHLAISNVELTPVTFVHRLIEEFTLWAFGNKYHEIRFDPSKLIEAWNELHGAEWTITEEEPVEHNFAAINYLWELEVHSMLKSHFHKKERN